MRALMGVALAVLLVGACQREEREVRPDPGSSPGEPEVTLSTIAPGVERPMQPAHPQRDDFESNAYHVSEGKRLFKWFNCNGCHANGGGDSGPPLMDDNWIYGGELENIVATIEQGRPNGMPSFRGRIPDDQIWEIAAYVRSMGRNVSKAVAPARNDDLDPGEAEQRRERGTVVPGGTVSPAGEKPQ